MSLIGKDGRELARGPELRLTPEGNATFTLRDVTIGINFHWERKEDQTFEGGLRLLRNEDGTITAINDAGVEQYLKSVISSEMSADGAARTVARARDHVAKLAGRHAGAAEAVQERRRPGPARARDGGGDRALV